MAQSSRSEKSRSSGRCDAVSQAAANPKVILILRKDTSMFACKAVYHVLEECYVSQMASTLDNFRHVHIFLLLARFSVTNFTDTCTMSAARRTGKLCMHVDVADELWVWTQCHNRS